MAESSRSNTQRGSAADGEAYRRLQEMVDNGWIKLLTVWCSEKGSLPADGHFCGAGTDHLPETFEILPRPGDGWALERPRPVVFTLPLGESKGQPK